MKSPYNVPPFEPSPAGEITYIWWSWHPNYPYWSQSCWKASCIQDAQRHLDKLRYYHNKLIKHDGRTLEEVQDVPCQEMEAWWKIYNRKNEDIDNERGM